MNTNTITCPTCIGCGEEHNIGGILCWDCVSITHERKPHAWPGGEIICDRCLDAPMQVGA